MRTEGQGAATQRVAFLKDPFHQEKTPYDTLGLQRGATKAEVDAAFKARLISQRGAGARVAAARAALLDETDRALVDVFLYDAAALQRLQPNPLDDPSALDPSHRQATATSWEAHLRSVFPNVATAHSLGLLWYWWAIHQEESSGAAAPVAVDRMWAKAIACLSLACVDDQFWHGLGGLDMAGTAKASEATMNRIVARMHEFGQRHHTSGATDVAKQYRDLELSFRTEIEAARLLGDAGVRNSRGKLACGPLLLQQVGLLEEVRRQVRTRAESQPKTERWKRLQEVLSPFAVVSMKVSSGDFAGAIAGLDVFPKPERGLSEARSLYASAHHGIARQHAESRRLLQALDSWSAALGFCGWKPELSLLRAEICADIVRTCQAHAAGQASPMGETIQALEKAILLVNDENLKLVLAEMLTRRGIETINAAQKGDEATPGPKMKKAVRSGVADLERAASLGLVRAKEQLEIARKLEREVNSEALGLLTLAQQAAQEDRWSDSIRHLRKALEVATPEEVSMVKSFLSVSLANHAIGEVNELIEQMQAGRTQPVDTRAQLRKAERELIEAVTLDPDNQHAKDSLRQLRSLLPSAVLHSTDPFMQPVGQDSATTWRPAPTAYHEPIPAAQTSWIVTALLVLFSWPWCLAWGWVISLYLGATFQVSPSTRGVITILAIIVFLMRMRHVRQQE